MRSRRSWLLAGLVSVAFSVVAACGPSDGRVVVRAEPPGPSDANVRGPIGERLTVTERIDVAGLDQPADVVRDDFGIVHIFARSPRDAFRVEGWMMARDRALQLEFLRRTALGRTAAVYASQDPAFIDQDIAMRALGLGRIAKATLDAMDPGGEPRELLEAFSDGISQHFSLVRAGQETVVGAPVDLGPDDFRPWAPTDSLAIALLNAAAVSLPTVQELALERLFGGVATAFPADSALPALARRAHVLPDLVRFAPPDPASVLPLASPAGPSSTLRGGSSRPGSPNARSSAVSLDTLGHAVATARVWESALSIVGRYGDVGSNTWAVAPARSATGNAMLATDPHLRLGSPAALWLVHLDVTADDASADSRDLHAAGAAMAGVPGIAYGFNRNLAWGAAASYFDTADLYRETISSDGAGVRYLGGDVPFDRVQETIEIQGQAALSFEVLSVPHHGPVLPRVEAHTVLQPDAGSDAISLRWVGSEGSTDFEAMLALLRAGDVDDARAAMKRVETSGLSFVFADSGGRVLYSAHARVPARDSGALDWDPLQYKGMLPCRVLPGDGSAEWTGYLGDTALPESADPIEGFVATANADPIGGSLDNDPANDELPEGGSSFLGCAFDPGFRLGRIRTLLSDATSLHTLDGMSAVQSDIRSPLGARIAPRLVDALSRALAEKAKPGTYPHLTELASSQRFSEAGVDSTLQLLQDWAALADYEASAGVKYADMQPSADIYYATGSKAAMLFNAWLVRLTQRTFADEASVLGFGGNLPDSVLVRSLLHLLETDPTMLASYDEVLRDSILWDDLTTPDSETRDEMMVSSLLDATVWLEAQFGSNRDDWRWGMLHTVRLDPLVPQVGGFEVPPAGDSVFQRGFPRPGDLFVIDAAPYDLTPSSWDAAGFQADEGPALRLVVDLAPSGPVARAVIAGGQIAQPASSHFADDAEYWRNDRTHDLGFSLDAVIDAAESRAVAWSWESP